MTTPSLADLRRAFFGGSGSVSDAEYAQLLELYGQGMTLPDIAAAGQTIEGVYNGLSGLSRWQLLMAPAARHNVVIYGDSNVWHDNAFATTTWADALQARIMTQTGKASGGAGMRHMGLASEWARAGAWKKMDGTFPLELGYPGTDLGPTGFAYSGLDTSAIATWTLPGGFPAHDRFDIYGIDDDSLAFLQPDYSLNGGAFTAMAWDIASTLGIRLVKQTIMGTVTSTLRVRGTNALIPQFFAGVAFYQGTTGIVVHNLAIEGGGVNIYAGPTGGNRLAIVDDLQPKLSIIMTGANETFHGGVFELEQMSLDDYYDYYTRIAQRCRLYGDVLLVHETEMKIPNALNDQTGALIQHDYARTSRTVARENDCGHLDIQGLWGSWANVNARARMADDFHLNQAGQNAVSDLIWKALTVAVP